MEVKNLQVKTLDVVKNFSLSERRQVDITCQERNA